MGEPLFREVLITVVSVGIAIGSGFGFMLWIAKHTLGRWAQRVEAIPEKEWFDKVERQVDILPTVNGKLDFLDRQAMDHEMRVRQLEHISIRGHHAVDRGYVERNATK